MIKSSDLDLLTPVGLFNNEVSVNSYKDFIYSLNLTKTNIDAKSLDVKFGVNSDETKYFELTLDFENQNVSIGSKDEGLIKGVSYNLESNVLYRLDFVVNDGLAKVYLKDLGQSSSESVALLVLKLDGYEEGKIITDLVNSHFEYSNVTISNLKTTTADAYVGGYTVNSVINLTDNNYQLKTNEYVVSNGYINIQNSYLNTLENNTYYKFRAVTSLTDLDFYVQTKEVGVQAFAATNEFYRGNDLRFELSQSAEVYRVVIDETEFDNFTQNETKDRVNIDKTVSDSLRTGDHRVKFYTDNGRPEVVFSINEVVEVVPEIPAPVSHVFFFIDIAIFAALILGYLGFSFYQNHKK